jgi:hypothetical protein
MNKDWLNDSYVGRDCFTAARKKIKKNNTQHEVIRSLDQDLLSHQKNCGETYCMVKFINPMEEFLRRNVAHAKMFPSM